MIKILATTNGHQVCAKLLTYYVFMYLGGLTLVNHRSKPSTSERGKEAGLTQWVYDNFGLGDQCGNN